MWELWGEHDSTVERGYWVHNMEHGGVVLGYRCADELDVLREAIAARSSMGSLVKIAGT